MPRQFEPSHLILILGLPRSGTSWLGKVFDTHPDVLYRHEPDIVLPSKTLGSFCASAEMPRFAEYATKYLNELGRIGTAKTAGPSPTFRKSYHSASQHLLRIALISVLRLLGQAPFGSKIYKSVSVGHFLDGGKLPSHLVIKSVNQVGCAGLFTHQVPGIRTILVVRDPYAQIASTLGGIRTGKFERDVINPSTVDAYWAKQRGLTSEQFQRMGVVEQLAWQWLIFNEQALADLAGCANARIVRHSDLVANAHSASTALFAFAGLRWTAATERFITDSQNSSRHPRYYGVYRDRQLFGREPWHQMLKTKDRQCIADIVRDSAPGRLVGV